MNTIKFFDCDREIEAVTSLNDLLVLFINGKTVNFSLKNFTKFDPMTKVYKFIYNNISYIMEIEFGKTQSITYIKVV